MLTALVASVVAPARAGIIHTVPIGNAGNPANGDGFGSVAYNFRISTTEITNAQYVEFLNAVAAADPYALYNTNMGAAWWGGIVRGGSAGSYTYSVKPPALDGAYSYDNKPAVFVSWGSAARLANWLHNGQPIGAEGAATTENGAYALNGAITDAALAAVTRNPSARWALPSENEWYKAAYYDAAAARYHAYATGDDLRPDNNLPSADTGNSANFYDGDPGGEGGTGYTTGIMEYSLTDAGAYTLSGSPYGALDLSGNVHEWNEALISGSYRGFRGGSWNSFSDDLLSGFRPSGLPTQGAESIGFRIVEVPEPAITCLSSLALLLGKRRKVGAAGG
jgi:formylglycine-generating enzyme required for sulfatase activity